MKIISQKSSELIERLDNLKQWTHSVEDNQEVKSSSLTFEKMKIQIKENNACADQQPMTVIDKVSD